MDTRIPSLDKLNQPDFVARLQAGDETAYQNVVEELATWFAVYIKRKFGITEEDAKDLVQDVIMNVYRKIKRFEQFVGLMLLGASEDYTMGIMQINTHSAFRSLKSRVLSKLRMEIQQLK